ncbi:hypothetical protein, partial [Proteus mirabilis]
IDKEQYKKDTRISHTKKLSYFNIIEITYNMSRFIEEGNYRSKSSKEYIKNNFNLSSNEYGKVINIIENDFFINNILNLENKLIYLENDDIRNLFAIIAPYIQLEEKSNTSGTIIKVSDVISSYDLKSEIITKKNQALKKIITYFDN